MSNIGGFFELEKVLQNDMSYHPVASELSTGRGCLALIIEVIKPELIYLPFYTCDALLGPIVEKGIKYEFYELNSEFKISKLPILKPKDLIIYINYFGVMSDYVKELRNYYVEQLVVDNTQAFYDKSDTENWAFNSARKFFGVPDGAYLYGLSSKEKLQPNVRISINHLLYRSIGHQKEAYKEFVEYEQGIDNSISGISELSKQILSNVDYSTCAYKRLQNFKTYHECLSKYNNFSMSSICKLNEPFFCYPLILNKPIDREALFSKGIFIPWLWKDVLNRQVLGYNWEKSLVNLLLPLPIDQRYGFQDVGYVIECIISQITLQNE